MNTTTTPQQLFEVMRLKFLNGFMAHPENFDMAMAYAYYRRLPPIVHLEGKDPFEGCYRISNDFAQSVYFHLFDSWERGAISSLTFYRLEEDVPEARKLRWELHELLGYFKIVGAIHSDVFDQVVSDAPAWARTIPDSFHPRDIYFEGSFFGP